MAFPSPVSAVPGVAQPGASIPGCLAPSSAQSGMLPLVTTVTPLGAQVFTTAGLSFPWFLIVANAGPAAVCAGGPGVTVAGGVMVAAGSALYVPGPARDVWAVTASGTAVVTAGLASVASVI